MIFTVAGKHLLVITHHYILEQTKFQYWRCSCKQNGADPAKLILGLANYGRTFTNKSEYSLGAPASGNGNPLPVNKLYNHCKSYILNDAI